MLGVSKGKIEGKQFISSAETAKSVIPGDCVKVLSQSSSAIIDLVLTDPPYIAKYVSRDGQRIANELCCNQ
jgi:site-specific DNA-methyltransferase (adenine-specific)